MIYTLSFPVFNPNENVFINNILKNLRIIDSHIEVFPGLFVINSSEEIYETSVCLKDIFLERSFLVNPIDIYNCNGNLPQEIWHWIDNETHFSRRKYMTHFNPHNSR